VVVHTHADDKHQDEYLDPLLGFAHLDGPSMQIGNPNRVNERMKKWMIESGKAGKRWLVNLDEIGPHWKGVMPDSYDAAHDTLRQDCLWGALLAGGAGVEWYFGYRYPHTDLTCEDFRSRDAWWKQSTIATQFIRQFPLQEMQPNNKLVNVKGAFCLEKLGEIFVLYLPAGTQNAKINLPAGKIFSPKWFNPRAGGEWMDGASKRIQGNGFVSVGTPPTDADRDWVVVVR
jgi:hypothetical protein